MLKDFERELYQLKHSGSDDLYRLFHQMQFQVLGPQWSAHASTLLGNSTHYNVAELFGPRSPELPEWYNEEILQEIPKFRQHDVLILHHVLDFLEDPLEALRVASKSGFKVILVHEAPKDGSFSYQSNPEIPFFKNRHLLASERHEQDEGNKALDYILKNLSNLGLILESSTDLDFRYSTDSNKRTLVKMELALDLIEHRMSGHLSKFEELLPEMMSWYSSLESQVVVKGCSRWLKLGLLKKGN